MFLCCTSYVLLKLISIALNHHLQTFPLPHLHFSLCPFLPLCPALSLSYSLFLSLPCKLCLFPVCWGANGGEVQRERKALSQFKCTGLKTQLAPTKGNMTRGKQSEKGRIMTYWQASCVHRGSTEIISQKKGEIKKKIVNRKTEKKCLLPFSSPRILLLFPPTFSQSLSLPLSSTSFLPCLHVCTLAHTRARTHRYTHDDWCLRPPSLAFSVFSALSAPLRLLCVFVLSVQRMVEPVLRSFQHMLYPSHKLSSNSSSSSSSSSSSCLSLSCLWLWSACLSLWYFSSNRWFPLSIRHVSLSKSRVWTGRGKEKSCPRKEEMRQQRIKCDEAGVK